MYKSFYKFVLKTCFLHTNSAHYSTEDSDGSILRLDNVVVIQDPLVIFVGEFEPALNTLGRSFEAFAVSIDGVICFGSEAENKLYKRVIKINKNSTQFGLPDFYSIELSSTKFISTHLNLRYETPIFR